MRMLRSALVLGLVLTCLVPAIGAADVLEKKIEHNLGLGSGAQSWEHRIDLPEDWAARGLFFARRSLTLDGRLVIEREELAKTYYFVKVRLPKEQLLPMKGSLVVKLDALPTPILTPVIAPCERLTITERVNPTFSWTGMGKYTAITLLEREGAKTVWERVITSGTVARLDESVLRVGRRYLWAVKQSDEIAKYGPEAMAAFRVGTKMETCHTCMGTGYVRCNSCGGSGVIATQGPNGTVVMKQCTWCHGSGRMRCDRCNGFGHTQVPIIITEPVN